MGLSTPASSRQRDTSVEPSTRTGDPGSSSDGALPGTAVRRNITQRRSKGRAKDDGETAPRASLLARRPRSRCKDRRYSVETVGNEAECERKDWRAVSARHPPPSTPGGIYRIAPYPAGDPEYGLRYARPLHGPSLLSPEHGEVKGNMGVRGHGRDNKHDTSSMPVAQPESRVSASSGISAQMDTSIPFMKDMIPSEKEYPALHRS